MCEEPKINTPEWAVISYINGNWGEVSEWLKKVRKVTVLQFASELSKHESGAIAKTIRLLQR